MINKENRTFCIYRLIGTIGAFLILVTAIIGGGGLGIFIDIPSILFTYGITFFLLLSTFRKDFLRFIPESILSLFFIPSKPNLRFAEIATYGSRYVIGVGVIGTLISLILMLTSLEDPSQIGGGMAVSFLTMFLALIASELFFTFVFKVFSDNESESKSKPLLFGNLVIVFLVLTIAFIIFFVLIASFTAI